MHDTTSRNRAVHKLLSLCAAAVVTSSALLGAATAAEPPKEWDGLQLRDSKNVDRLYVRPGASLAGYKRVRVERLVVQFDKNWDPNRSRVGSYRLTKEDFEKIKNGLADEFAKTFPKELAEGGYQTADEAGPDVLDVTPIVVDLYIAAPDKMMPGRSYTYTADPGRMTLVAELRDSETQQILARAIDAQRATSTATFQISNSVTNLAAAQRIIDRWSSLLRKALDAANGR
jgi:uncharacterized protein DUF3313